MLMASAIVSLGAVVWLSGRLVRHTPAKVVPLVFALSAAGLLAEWGLVFTLPRVAVMAVYLHTAVFGGLAVSAFWSLATETFAGHSGRRAVTWIAAGGAVGGVVGGVIAWRMAGLIPPPSMLPLLAAINAVCVWGSLRMQATPKSAGAPDADVPDADADASPEGRHPAEVIMMAYAPPVIPVVARATAFAALRGAPYLRNLALVVLLGGATSTFLDYVFYAVATEHYAKGPPLLASFAQFWLAIGALSFFVQAVVGRLSLSKLGVAFTVATLPALVLVGGALGIAVPGLTAMVGLRGAEATHRNSLFRSAYELLYTPLAEDRKRATKTLIDVGCDRAGMALAGGIAMATVAVVPDREPASSSS